MATRLKYEDFITKIETALDIKLFPFEREYLNALLIAKKYNKRLLVARARRNSSSFTRVDLIYMLIMETTQKLEDYVLYGNRDSSIDVKGIYNELGGYR